MKFLEKAELAKLSDAERFKYERSLKVYRDDLLVITTAREDGFKSSIVQVVNLETKKTVYAEVINSNTVEVNF